LTEMGPKHSARQEKTRKNCPGAKNRLASEPDATIGKKTSQVKRGGDSGGRGV